VNSRSSRPLPYVAPPVLAGTSFPHLAAPYRSCRDRYARPQSANRYAKVAPEEIVNGKYNRPPGGCKTCITQHPAGDRPHRRLKSCGGQRPSRRTLGSGVMRRPPGAPIAPQECGSGGSGPRCLLRERSACFACSAGVIGLPLSCRWRRVEVTVVRRPCEVKLVVEPTHQEWWGRV